MQYYTYGEDVLLFNFLFDFMIVFLASKLVLGSVKPLPLFCASLLGSLYALAAVLFPAYFAGHTVKLISCLIMSLILLMGYEFRLKLLVCLSFSIYGLSFFFSGTVLFLFEEFAGVGKMGPAVSLCVGIMCVVFLFCGINAYKYKVRENASLYTGRLVCRGKNVEVQLFLDTGNNVSKIYGKHVVFLDETIIKLIFNDSIFSNDRSYTTFLEQIQKGNKPLGVEIVFVSTATSVMEPMLAFLLDRVEILRDHATVVCRENVWGVMMKDSLANVGFSGLISADFIFD